MTNALPKLIGAAALVVVIGGGVMLVKGQGHKDVPAAPLPPPAVTALAPPPEAVAVAPKKPRFKRDMLDYEVPAPVVAAAATTIAPPTPTPAQTAKILLPDAGNSSTPGSNFNLATIPPPIASTPKPETRVDLQAPKTSGKLKLESARIEPGTKIALPYTCYKTNISPPLHWGGAPSGTKNFVVVLEGPDKGSGHPLQWGVYNIPATETALPEGLPKTPSTDKGAQAETDVGPTGYSGPCIPKGEFTYVFSVFALDAELKLHPGATRDELFKAMNGHILDTARLPVQHFYRR